MLLTVILVVAVPDLDAGPRDASIGGSFGAWFREGPPEAFAPDAGTLGSVVPPLPSPTFVADDRGWFTRWALSCPLGTWCFWKYYDFPDGRVTRRPAWADDRPWPTTFYSVGRPTSPEWAVRGRVHHVAYWRHDADAGVHHPPGIEVSRRPPRRANGEWDVRLGLLRYGVVVAVAGTDYGWREPPPEPSWELYEWAVGPRPNEEQEEPEPIYGYPDVARARTCAVGWTWVRPHWSSGEEHVYVACDPRGAEICEAPPDGLDRSATYVLRRWWELRAGPATAEPLDARRARHHEDRGGDQLQ